MTESLQLHVAAEGNEVVIRQGQAEHIEPKKDVSVTGHIATPGNIYQAQPERYTAKNSRLHITDDSISLVYHEDFRREEHYTGLIKIHPQAFLQWIHGIGKDTTTMSPKDLAQRIKFNQRFFADRSQAVDVMQQLRSLRAKVTSDIEQASDDKGNRRSVYDKKLKSNVGDIKFTIEAPLIEHATKATFEVEVLIDERDGGISVWMESIEAVDLIETYKRNAKLEQLARFEDSGIPKVYQ